MQPKGANARDAAAPLMPMVRFISPVHPMRLSTMKAIEEQLIVDTLVRRYRLEHTQVDGLPGSGGSLTACSFWYVERLAPAGELEKAQLLLRSCSATRTIWIFIQKSWVPTAGISAISRKRSHISH